MSAVYYTLIKNKKMTIDDVPEKDKAAVQALLDVNAN